MPWMTFPFFVVGAMRSGTTILRLILDRHPDIAIPPESHFIPRLYANRDQYGAGGIVQRPQRFLVDLTGDPWFAAWKLPHEAIQAADLAGLSFSGAIDAVFHAYALHHKKKRWGDKTPGHILQIPLLASLFPESRFVHLIRDGRDVSLSMHSVSWFRMQPSVPAFFWTRDVKRGRSDGKTLHPARYLEIFYERILQDPEAEVGRLCEFLNVSFDSSMLDARVDDAEKIPPDQRWMHPNAALPIKSGLRDWKRDLSPADIAMWEAIGGSQLSAAGYRRFTRKTNVVRWIFAWLEVAWFGLRTFPARLKLRSQARTRLEQGKRSAQRID